MENYSKIVILEPFGVGGICHYTYQLAQGLSRHGVNVTVYTDGKYELESLARNFKVNKQMGCSQIKKFIVSMFSSTKSNDNDNDAGNDNNAQESALVLKIRRWVIRLELAVSFLQERVPILHFQWLSHPDEEYYFLRLLQFLGFKIVYTAHNVVPHDNYHSHVISDLGRIYRTVDRIIVHAERNKAELARDFCIDPGKICVIPHGNYDMFYQEPPTPKGVARSRLRIPQSKKVILFFGVIRRYKGLEYLVEAFGRLMSKDKAAILLIVGELPNTDQEDYRFYSNLLASLQGRENIVYVNEYIPLQQVPDYFFASDLVVLPYVKTFQSGVLYLAYSAGRAVLVTDTGGMGEVVENGQSGFVIPPQDVNALANTLYEALSDMDQLEKLGMHGRTLSDTKYSWEQIGLETVALYKSLIPGKCE